MIALSRARGALWLAVLMAFLVLPALPASASTVTYKILFAAQGITGPGSPPATTAGGLFTLTLDPGHSYAIPADFAGSSISTDFLSVPVDSAVGFLYDHATDALTIGGIAGTPAFLVTTQNDFAVIIQSFSTNPIMYAFGMTNGAPGATWGSTQGIVVTQIVPVAATPVPGTLLLLVTALAGLVGWKFAGRRRSIPAAA